MALSQPGGGPLDPDPLPLNRPEPRRLRRRHFMALSIVALLTLAGQGVIQFALWGQQADAGFVNIAGRQRMWSQRITQLALRASCGPTDDARQAAADLPAQLEAWQRAHQQLLAGDAGLGPVAPPEADVIEHLHQVEPSLRALVAGVDALLAALAAHDDQLAASGKPAMGPAGVPISQRVHDALAQILSAQDTFLLRMDETVFRAAEASNRRVHTLQIIELVQLTLVLLTLLAEGRFILRPAVLAIARSLARAEASARARGAAEAAQAAMVAALPDRLVRVDAAGHPVAVLADPGGKNPTETGLWDADGVPEPAVARLVAAARAIRGLAGPEDVALVAMMGPDGIPDTSQVLHDALGDSMEVFEVIEEIRVVSVNDGALVLARDVTASRRAERTLFAADEAARRMVGRDLHDGLCQELAALHYLARSLASRAGRNGSAEAEALDRLAGQLEHTVEAGRRLSRGLYPLDLEVGGLGLALQALAERATVPGGPTVVVAVSGDAGLPPDVALQLYRIAQEAVANALRHADSTQVSLKFSLEPDGGHLLVIGDNGRGNTAPPQPPGAPNGSRGLGRESMARRAALIGARLDVTLSGDAGTSVRCFIPALVTARGNS